MGDEHEFQLEGDRRPLFGDVRDVGALRAWARTNAQNEVALTGRLRSAFVYVMEGTSEHFAVGKAEDIGKETILAALFQDLARRDGVVRALREGERIVEVDGRNRRAAVIIEWDLASGAWWLGSRLFGTGEASVGVFHGDWVEREGATLDELDEPFREWLDRGTATIETKGQQLVPGPAEDIRVATIPWPALPLDVPGVGVQIAQAFIPEFLQRPLDFHVVFACREGALERWEVRGKLGVPIDDLIRAIAAQAHAEAVAYLVPSVIELGGVTRRCYLMLVERGGHVGQFVLPLDIKDGKIQGGDLKYRDEGPAKHQWIGVAPEHPVDLRMQGPADGKELPEGWLQTGSVFGGKGRSAAAPLHTIGAVRWSAATRCVRPVSAWRPVSSVACSEKGTLGSSLALVGRTETLHRKPTQEPRNPARSAPNITRSSLAPGMSARSPGRFTPPRGALGRATRRPPPRRHGACTPPGPFARSGGGRRTRACTSRTW